MGKWDDPDQFPPNIASQIKAAQQAPAIGAISEITITPRPPRERPEQKLQQAIIELADLWRMPVTPDDWPDEIVNSKVGDWLFHIPNGGHRTPAEAGLFRSMGVRAGVSDLFFMIPTYRNGTLSRAAYAVAGLFIELKAGEGKLTDNQLAFHQRAVAAGYSAVEVRSIEAFRVQIASYLLDAQPI